jgi:ssDNA-binding Zn-finger/Zn-ribbon topoisomerase 1
MTSKNKSDNKKQENLTQNIKESNTIDKKHKEIIKNFSDDKLNINNLSNELEEINNNLSELDKNREKFTLDDLNMRAELLNKKDILELQKNNIQNNFNEMDYYDKTGDLIIEYYELRDNKDQVVKETRNILEFLGKNKNEIKNKNKNELNRAELFNKYWQRIEGVRVNLDDGTKRIKYCNECNFEKILDYSVSAYLCPCCGDVEDIILDEDRQIKDYSPYQRINHFREWLNQFQAKQSPEIPDIVFQDIINELNKNRIVDLSQINKKKMKLILKKLGHNGYYEHVHYIMNKLSNLPPPKITRDMEKIFIKMFKKIEVPWEKFKQPGRKNFLSYSYVLYKFCELLELDHLLECFSLHKAPEKLMENDEIWKKICNYLHWEYISSFK